MAAFDYVALDGRGKKVSGVLEADSSRLVRQALRDKGLFPVDINQTKEKRQSSGSFSFAPNMSVADLSLMTRQLATLIGSGMPLEESLRALAEQSEKPKVKSMVMAIRSKVLEGYSLADALTEFKRAFPPLYRATVAAGEKSGNLDLVLNRLADYVEDQHETNKKVKQSAVYPALLVIISISVVVFLLNSVIPKILGVITKKGAELPKPTQIVIGLSEFLQAYWIHMIVAAALVFILFTLWNKNTERRKKTHAVLLKLPLLGKISRGFSSSRYASTLAILTSSGVPLVEAMHIGNEVVENLVIKESLVVAAKKVSEGGSLSVALKETGFFPPMMVYMIASGEASGELDSMLERTSKSQEQGLKDLISTVVGLMEPLVLVLMGGIILMIVMAVVLPMLQLNQMVG